MTNIYIGNISWWPVMAIFKNINILSSDSEKNSSPAIKPVKNTHNFLVGYRLDVVCVSVCLHAGDDDTNYFSPSPPSLLCFQNIVQLLSWLWLPPNCWFLPVEVWTGDTGALESPSDIHRSLLPWTHPSPINWRDQRGVRAGGEGDITQVGWGWFSVNRQWKFKSSNLFLGTINCEFMKSHAGKSWGLGQ